MKIICPHCSDEQEFSLRLLMTPVCHNCNMNMTKQIGRKYLICKWIARFLALMPVVLESFYEESSIWAYILMLVCSCSLFAIVEILFLKVAFMIKDK